MVDLLMICSIALPKWVFLSISTYKATVLVKNILQNKKLIAELKFIVLQYVFCQKF